MLILRNHRPTVDDKPSPEQDIDYISKFIARQSMKQIYAGDGANP